MLKIPEMIWKIPEEISGNAGKLLKIPGRDEQ